MAELRTWNEGELCGQLLRVDLAKDFQDAAMADRSQRKPTRNSRSAADDEVTVDKSSDLSAEIAGCRDPQLLEQRRDARRREPAVSGALARKLGEDQDALVCAPEELNLESKAAFYVLSPPASERTSVVASS